MRKVYLSYPMYGRDVEKVRQTTRDLAKFADSFWGDDVWVLTGYTEDKDIVEPNNEKVWRLGKALENMSHADSVVILETDAYTECTIEKYVAVLYDMDVLMVTTEQMKNMECFSDIADII